VTDPVDLDRLYRHRFSEADAARKLAVWAAIVGFLARWIPRDGAVIDIACDEGYFIHNVVAAERWATDIRDITSLGEGIRFVNVDGLDLANAVPGGHFDVAFMRTTSSTCRRRTPWSPRCGRSTGSSSPAGA
jgi:hypothetical protein